MKPSEALTADRQHLQFFTLHSAGRPDSIALGVEAAWHRVFEKGIPFDFLQRFDCTYSTLFHDDLSRNIDIKISPNHILVTFICYDLLPLAAAAAWHGLGLSIAPVSLSPSPLRWCQNSQHVNDDLVPSVARC